MDPLSVTANVITVLQVANSVITICYEVRSALKQSPWSLTRTIDEIRDLRNVLESLEQVCRALDTSKESDTARFRTFQLLCESETSPLSRCLQELLDLEKKINSGKQTPGRSTLLAKARVFAQVMGWQLKEGDAKMIDPELLHIGWLQGRLGRAMKQPLPQGNLEQAAGSSSRRCFKPGLSLATLDYG
ncbi:uncharacterized protein J4E78_005559 [Alternaria triticimaculans]|uniref:uncharacterized protein n=1 Tax=Alternaria triticimaculans TaxID=297637 RepID=UPI0020C58519|nr:uncharacterized protein J4E78_005559 [Alternaria triticimaculans]KAI4659135.1 hypothetical protein J4E78_005559 [Alternaria triticimaculans]